jgi:O-antigen/teichoic acid export membrane protein
MESTAQLTSNETVPAVSSKARADQETRSWLRPPWLAIPAPAKLMPVAYSVVDQALVVGAGFLVNIALARTQTKEEYGMFTLSYSVFTFLSGLHNAAILEPYTVYGSGRYRDRFSEYLRLMVRSNALMGVLLTGILLSGGLLLLRIAPQFAPRALWGLGLTVGVLLSGAFLRRVFYLQRQAVLAAKTSLVYFITVACGLWLTTKAHRLNSFSVFLILALGWIAGGAAFGRKLALGKRGQRFLELEPRYWGEHWKYAKWVLATAFVFQLMNQGYYWIVAGFLSVKEVAELRATYLLIAPVEQVVISLSFLALPVLAANYAAKSMDGFLSQWKRYALAVLSVTAAFALVVRVLGKQAIHVVYSGKFDDQATLIFTLALVPLLMALGNTMNDALKAIEKPRFVFYAYLCSGAATFLGGIPLVIHFGLRGAVYGMLLSAGTYTTALGVGFFLAMSVRQEAIMNASDDHQVFSTAYRNRSIRD